MLRFLLIFPLKNISDDENFCVADVAAAAAQNAEPAAAYTEAAAVDAAAAAAGGDKPCSAGEAGPALEHGGHHAAQRDPAALCQRT